MTLPSVAADSDGDGVDDLVDTFPNDITRWEGHTGILYSIDGTQVGQFFGGTVEAAGDINKDGYADFIVGAYEDSTAGDRAGMVQVFSGLDGSVIYTFYGADELHRLGSSLGSGDVNGDGYDDILVAASWSRTLHVFSGLNGNELYTVSGDEGENWLGLEVSAAGDVNADGYVDVIVGIPVYDEVAHVLSGVDGSRLYTFSDNGNDSFGVSVDGVGDINNDGYDDVIVGADDAQYQSGSVFVYSGFDGGLLYQFDGINSGDNFGYAVAGAGDVNADGYPDFLVGAPDESLTAGYDEGVVRVFSGQDGTVLYTLYGEFDYDSLGVAVSKAGDINLDGYADFMVGASGDDNNGAQSGMLRVYSGIDGSIIYGINGDGPADYMGGVISYAGDIDADGYPDFLAGMYLNDNSWLENSGTARVYSGGAFWSDKDNDGINDAEDEDDDNDGVIDIHDFHIFDASQAGDYDSDGVDGIIDNCIFLANPDQQDVDSDGKGDICDNDIDGDGVLNDQDSWPYDAGSTEGDTPWLASFFGRGLGYAGHSVSGAGDVNNDGYADVVVGAYFSSRYGDQYSGYAKVYSGATLELLYLMVGEEREGIGRSVSGAGDVNNDGYDDVIVGGHGIGSNVTGVARVYSGKDGSELYELRSGEDADRFGSAVSGAGDVNNDGYADLIVGAYESNLYGYHRGAVYIYSGQDGSLIYTLPSSYVRFGYSVSGAGDVNGDGYDDVIVGTFWGSAASSARVYSGFDASELYVFDDGLEDEYLGSSVSGAGDVNNDGYADLIIGIERARTSRGPQAGMARVISGVDGSVLYEFGGDSAYDRFGHSVSGAGDVNADGYADLVVGAIDDQNQGESAGMARVFSGADGSILYTVDGINYGYQYGDDFGSSVSAAGDINNDGYDDVIIGGPGNRKYGSSAGVARIISGKGRWTDSDGDLIDDPIDTDDDNDGYPDIDDSFPQDPSRAADFDGDGLDDFVDLDDDNDSVPDIRDPGPFNDAVPFSIRNHDSTGNGTGDLFLWSGTGVFHWGLWDAELTYRQNVESPAPVGSVIKTVTDITALGDAEVIFQNPATYAVDRLSSYIGVQSGYTLSSVVADVDFDGDADLILEDGTGSIIIWLMQDGQKQSGVWLGTWAGHQVMASGDLDADGDDDLVTQDTLGNVNVIEMENGARVAARWLGQWAGRTVVGAGDADNDIDADIFMTADSGAGDGGDVMVIEIENATKVIGRWLGIWSGTDVKYVGDIDQDGDKDLIQQNSTTGSVQVVEIEDGAKVTGRWITTINYDVKGAVDGDGDGDVDIILQDGSGNVALIELENGMKSGGTKWLGINSAEVKIFH